MPKITEMFAFIAEDGRPDNEGVIAQKIGDTWMPMIGADMARIDDIRPHAQALARQFGMKIKLVKFTTRTDVEEIDG